MADRTSSDRPLWFNLDGARNRTLSQWRALRRPGSSAKADIAARHYAKAHGAAGIWYADDSFVLWYMDGASLRRTSWRHACPVHLRRQAA